MGQASWEPIWPVSVLAGVAWFAGDLTDALLYAHRGPLVHLLLTYPAGASARAAAVVISAAYVDGLVPGARALEWPTIALMAAVVTVAAWRHRTVGGVERRARAAALAGAVDWRNACARCVRAWPAPIWMRPRPGPTTPRWRSRPPACRLTCCGAGGPVPPSLDWWSISATASSRTR